MSRHAKILTAEQLAEFEAYIRLNSHNPVRDMALMQLSFRAGMRVGEMAQLRWTDVTDAQGNVNDDVIYIPSQIVKFEKRNRTVPMHSRTKAALVALQRLHRDPVFVIHKLYADGSSRPLRPNTLAQYMRRLYDAANLPQATSHSGRRTFVTQLCRRANLHHCSVRDVQIMVGHSHIQTTERYIGPSDDVRKLVEAEL